MFGRVAQLLFEIVPKHIGTVAMHELSNMGRDRCDGCGEGRLVCAGCFLGGGSNLVCLVVALLLLLLLPGCLLKFDI